MSCSKRCTIYCNASWLGSRCKRPELSPPGLLRENRSRGIARSRDRKVLLEPVGAGGEQGCHGAQPQPAEPPGELLPQAIVLHIFTFASPPPQSDTSAEVSVLFSSFSKGSSTPICSVRVRKEATLGKPSRLFPIPPNLSWAQAPCFRPLVRLEDSAIFYVCSGLRVRARAPPSGAHGLKMFPPSTRPT